MLCREEFICRAYRKIYDGEYINLGIESKRNAYEFKQCTIRRKNSDWIFWKRKSSLVNAITGLELAVVSDVLGTTTDPVVKAKEILPLGPIIDTPGFDDEGHLGKKN